MSGLLIIRTYEPRDEAAVVGLVRELQVHEGRTYDRMKAPEEIGAWYITELEKQCAESEGRLLVGEIDGAIVAYATILSHVENDSIDEVAHSYALVGDLAVTSSRRGHGIGKAMLAECEGIARAQGATHLRITSLARNAEALATYRSYGFNEHLVGFEKPLR